jgi:HSP20 family protein
VPAVTIRENEKDYELELAVPGMKKEDFNVEVDNNVLTISAEVNSENAFEEDNFTRKEFSYSSFKRAFTLPETIDEDQIKSSYEDGVLIFELPKKTEALPNPKRKISIGK